MDYDPLVPKEMSPAKKAMTYAFLGGVSIFIFVTALLSVLHGSKHGHSGNYLAICGLILLAATSYLLYSWIPSDSVDDKVRYVILGQSGILVLLTLGVLLMTYQTIPCPECPKLKEPCKEAMIASAKDNWLNFEPCFTTPEDKKSTVVCISSTAKDSKHTCNMRMSSDFGLDLESLGLDFE